MGDRNPLGTHTDWLAVVGEAVPPTPRRPYRPYRRHYGPASSTLNPYRPAGGRKDIVTAVAVAAVASGVGLDAAHTAHRHYYQVGPSPGGQSDRIDSRHPF